MHPSSAMDSFQRPFKSHGGSHKYSSSRNLSQDLEEQPILLEKDDPEHSGEVVVKIDGNSHNRGPSAGSIGGGNAPNQVWRESSYEFWKSEGKDGCRSRNGNGNGNGGGGGGLRDKEGGDGFSFMSPQAEIAEDPPSRLIHTFLDQQRAKGAEMALDMDMEMEELRRNSISPATVFGSREPRVSFQAPSRDEPYPNQRSPSSDDNDTDDPDAELRHRKALTAMPDLGGAGVEVLRCTSNSSLRRNATMLRTKTRSRIMDPAPPPPQTAATNGNEEARRSGWIPKSGQIKSGFIGGKSQRMDEDDEDPFVDDHIPDEFKRTDLSWLTILQCVSLVLIVAAFACSLSVPSLRLMTAWELHLWKWLVLVFVLICGRLVSGWLVRLIVFCIERNFLLLRKRVLYFVYGVRRAVQNCLWLGLVLLSWQFLFNKNMQERVKSRSTLPYVTKVLFCLLVANLFRLAKTLFVKVLASSFHVSTYFDRIQESLFNQYVIETLSGPPLIEIQHIKQEEERTIAELQRLRNAGARIPTELEAAALSSKSGRLPAGNENIGKIIQTGKSFKFPAAKPLDEGITIEELHRLNQKNISAWRMKKLMRIVRYGTLTTLDEQVRQGAGEDDSVTQIRSEFEAKVAARKIFNNVARSGAKYIYFADLLRFLTDDEAHKIMSLFEGAQEKDRVSRRSLKNWVVNAFRERRALALTLNDTKTAVNKLHQMANVVVSIVVFVIWLLILDIATTHFFVFLSSQLLLLAFIFGNTLKMVFEAIIFLFAMHPYDVGDRCEINGVQMCVEEMNILTTIFLRYDNLKVAYPNSILATLPLANFYRSPDMGDSIDFCIHVATPLEKIAMMRERIVGYLESKKEHWYPGGQVVLRDVDDMNRLKVSIWMRHRINFQDMGERFVRRELAVQEMIKVLRELDIEYRMLPLDVNVRNMPVSNSTRLPSTWTALHS